MLCTILIVLLSLTSGTISAPKEANDKVDKRQVNPTCPSNDRSTYVIGNNPLYSVIIHCGVVIGGTSFDVSTQPNFAACIQQCSESKNCACVEYSPSTQQCGLKHSSSGSTSKTSAWSATVQVQAKRSVGFYKDYPLRSVAIETLAKRQSPYKRNVKCPQDHGALFVAHEDDNFACVFKVQCDVLHSGFHASVRKVHANNLDDCITACWPGDDKCKGVQYDPNSKLCQLQPVWDHWHSAKGNWGPVVHELWPKDGSIDHEQGPTEKHILNDETGLKEKRITFSSPSDVNCPRDNLTIFTTDDGLPFTIYCDATNEGEAFEISQHPDFASCIERCEAVTCLSTEYHPDTKKCDLKFWIWPPNPKAGAWSAVRGNNL